MRAVSMALIVAGLVGGAASTSSGAAPRTPGEAWFLRHRPVRGLAELGLHAGAFFPRDHELFDPRRVYEPLRPAAPEFGVRLAYFPLAFLGAELESATTPGRTATSGEPATVVALRAHVIAQLPYRLAPFVLIGYGALIQTSRRLGADVDAALHYGGGLKLFVTPIVALRLDFRADATGQYGQVGGRTQHLAALLGVSLTLGRPSPARPRSHAPKAMCSGPASDPVDCPPRASSSREPVLETTCHGSADPAGDCPPSAARPEGPRP